MKSNQVSGLVACAAMTAISSLPANAVSITGRTVPDPIVGVTFDDVSKSSSEVTALQSLAKFPTVRVVIDKGEAASYYKGPMTAFHPYAFIMAELVDSSYMAHYTLSSVQSLVASYTSSLGSLVDIWEVGNEVNGNWLSKLSNGSDVMPKIEAMYDSVSSQNGKTMLTFFYEGEPKDPNNCIAHDHGGNDMFSWIHANFTNAPTAETEKIRLGVNYVSISWYPDRCPGEMPNWGWVYNELAQIFPNAQVGFGELGTANPQNGSAYEKSEISSIYAMQAGTGGLPSNYFGGVFWWYAAEEIVPWPDTLGTAINNIISKLP